MDNLTLGQYIKQLREAKGYTIHTIDKLGFDKSHWFKLEKDQRVPKPDTLKMVSKVLEMPYIDLFIHAGFLTEEAIDEYLKWKNK